jgi:hypothetical protein
MFRLESRRLQLHHDVTLEPRVIEKQVDEELITGHFSSRLPASRTAGLNALKLHVKPLVEPGGIEPPTSALPVRRSPS